MNADVYTQQTGRRTHSAAMKDVLITCSGRNMKSWKNVSTQIFWKQIRTVEFGKKHPDRFWRYFLNPERLSSTSGWKIFSFFTELKRFLIIFWSYGCVYNHNVLRDRRGRFWFSERLQECFDTSKHRGDNKVGCFLCSWYNLMSEVCFFGVLSVCVSRSLLFLCVWD